MKFKLTRLSPTSSYTSGVILYRYNVALGEMHRRDAARYEGHRHQRRTRCRLELSQRGHARVCVPVA